MTERQDMYKKVFYLMIAATVTLAAAVTASAQTGKIGYVDSQRIFAESKDFADAQAKFDRDVAEWNKQAEDLQAEIEQLEKELESQSLLLSKAKRDEKEKLLKAKKEAFQDYVDATFGTDGKAERRNAELIRPIRDKIMRIIERIAIENNYSMILDAGVTSIAYAKKSLDITDMVLEELSKEE
jgi:outer membrane protein